MKGIFTRIFLAGVLTGSVAYSSDTEALKSESDARMNKLMDRAERMHIRALTRSRDASERAEAAVALGAHDSPAAIEALIGALKDKDPVVRRAACSALWELEENAISAMPALRVALNDISPAVQVRAAGALQAMGVPAGELVEVREQVLQNGETSDRFLAARGLIDFTSPTKLAPHMLDYAYEVCGTKGSSIDSFLDLSSAQKNNLEMAEEALMRLARKQDREVFPMLAERVKTYHYANRVPLMAAAEYIPVPDGWVELLVGQLAFGRKGLNQVVLNLLRQCLEPEQVAAWARPVADLVMGSDEYERRDALQVLGMGKGYAWEQAPVAAMVLRESLDNDLRRTAADTLGAMGDRTQPISAEAKLSVAGVAGPALHEVVTNERQEERLRREALRSWVKLQLPVDELVSTLSDLAQESRSRSIQSQALQALGNLGAQARAAVPVVEKLTTHPDPRVRRMAEATLPMLKRGRTASAVLPAGGTAANPDTEAKGLSVLQDKDALFTEQGFYQALTQADKEKVAAYLDSGMSPNHAFEMMNGATPLFVLLFGPNACKPGVRPTVAATRKLLQLLISRGADPNLADAKGNVPLMPAAQKCDAEVIRLLLEAGANYTVTNAQGLTPLEFGLWSATDGAKALVEAGARLPADKVETYRNACQSMPQVLELLEKAK